MVAQIDRRYVRTGRRNVSARMLSYAVFEGRPLTTRGRAANRILLPLLKSRAARATAAGPVAPAFIIGLGRTGTTLLGQILSVHPDVAWLNEPKLMWHVIFDDEDVIGSYEASDRGRLRLGVADVTPEVVGRAHAVAGSYLRQVRRRQLVDKYPELVFRTEFVRAIYPDARFLVLQRRAAASVQSISQWSEDHRAGGADWWGLHGKKWRTLYRELVAGDEELRDFVALDHTRNRQEHMAVVEWLTVAEESLRHLGEPGVLLVDYDRLVSDPRSEVRVILEHLGLPADRRTEDYAQAVCVSSRSRPQLPDGIPLGIQARVREAEVALGLDR